MYNKPGVNGVSHDDADGTATRVKGYEGSAHEIMNGLNGHIAPEDRPSPASTPSALTPTHSRKESNPLAPPFIVSAPGKTIVYGEHAVVHGKAAIAAAISLRSYLLVTTLSKSKRTVTLRFSDIGLDHTWNIAELPWKAFAHPSRKKKYYDLVTSLDEELVAAIQPHVTTISPDAESQTKKHHQGAASAFLYLFLSLGSESSPPCIYTLRSTIPIGQGLGSSASITVCISTALLLQCRALSGPHPDQQGAEAEEQLQRINRWAFVGELIIHGNPSGIDNTVATNGRALLFQRKDYSKPPSVSILRDWPELPLLLVDTCQPKSTAAEVAKVGALKKKHPAVVEGILNSIDSIVRSVYDVISNYDPESNAESSIQHLGELMSVNHGLLTSLGVSHPRLERLRYLVDQAGVGWTKLTGAGGGGCAITLLKPRSLPSLEEADGEACDMRSAKPGPTGLHELERQLDEEGFERYETTLGGDGVGILYPAVLHDEEIDQEMFLTARGAEGIEALVGGSKSTDLDAWKYWRP